MVVVVTILLFACNITYDKIYLHAFIHEKASKLETNKLVNFYEFCDLIVRYL